MPPKPTKSQSTADTERVLSLRPKKTAARARSVPTSCLSSQPTSPTLPNDSSAVPILSASLPTTPPPPTDSIVTPSSPAVPMPAAAGPAVNTIDVDTDLDHSMPDLTLGDPDITITSSNEPVTTNTKTTVTIEEVDDEDMHSTHNDKGKGRDYRPPSPRLSPLCRRRSEEEVVDLTNALASSRASPEIQQAFRAAEEQLSAEEQAQLNMALALSRGQEPQQTPGASSSAHTLDSTDPPAAKKQRVTEHEQPQPEPEPESKPDPFHIDNQDQDDIRTRPRSDITTPPLGGFNVDFPDPHHFTDNQDKIQTKAWAAISGPKARILVSGGRHISTLDAVPLLKSIISRETQTNETQLQIGPAVAAVTPRGNMTAPTSWIISGLNADALQHLLVLRFLAREGFSFEVSPFTPRIPTFLVALEVFIDTNGEDIPSTIVNNTLNNNKVRTAIASNFSALPTGTSASDAFHLFGQTLHIIRRVLAGRAGTQRPVWFVYAQPVTNDPSAYDRLRTAISNVSYATIFSGTGIVVRNAFLCRICHASDRPTDLCNLLQVEGWAGTTPDTFNNDDDDKPDNSNPQGNRRRGFGGPRGRHGGYG